MTVFRPLSRRFTKSTNNSARSSRSDGQYTFIFASLTVYGRITRGCDNLYHISELLPVQDFLKVSSLPICLRLTRTFAFTATPAKRARGQPTVPHFDFDSLWVPVRNPFKSSFLSFFPSSLPSFPFSATSFPALLFTSTQQE